MMVWSGWGWEDGVWLCGAGIAREYLQGRRLSHAVVAGCGAEVSILQQMSLESDGDGDGRGHAGHACVQVVAVLQWLIASGQRDARCQAQ